MGATLVGLAFVLPSFVMVVLLGMAYKLYSGLSIHWLNEQEFVDAGAVAMITPGPVVIAVAFIVLGIFIKGL